MAEAEKSPTVKRRGKLCQAINCNNYQNIRTDLLFSRFPKSDHERRAKWVQNCRNVALLNKTPQQLNNLVVCAMHFKDECFMDPQTRRSLVWNAVPTLVTCPNPPPDHTPKRKAPKQRAPPNIKRRKTSKDSLLPESLDSGVGSTATRSLKTSKEYQAEISNLQKKNQKLRVKVSRLQRKLATRLHKKTSIAQDKLKLIQSLREYLSGPALSIVSAQIRSAGKKKRFVHWSASDKATALSLLHQSPKCYNLLQKIFYLPTPSTLKRSIQGLDIKAGFNTAILEALKSKVESFPSNDKLCVLLFDEMAIKESLTYDSYNDVVEGFEDFGNGLRGQYVANHACVFMVRGLMKKWKQPVMYTLSSGPMKADTLHALMLECISKLQDIGLIVKVFICDQGSNNQSLLKKLKVSPERPFFTISGCQIYAMFDPPHLLKSVRNNFKKYGFEVNEDGVINDVRWLHVEEFFTFDSSLSIRMAPKLTHKHIALPPFSPMRVNLAAQVLSHSVAAGILTLTELGHLEPDATETADFIERMDKLFNIFNSKSNFGKQSFRSAIRHGTSHIPFLHEMLKFFQNMQPKPVETDRRPPTLACLSGWQLSISALVMLWGEVSTDYNVDSLLTNRLNQDCLENLFSVIRGKGIHRDNPSAEQFRAAFKQVLVDSLFFVSKGSNCIEDPDTYLLTLSQLSSKKRESQPQQYVEPVSDNIRAIMNVQSVFTPPLSLPEDNISVYIAGYLVKKAAIKLSCEKCVGKMQEMSPSADSRHIFINHKQYEHLHEVGKSLFKPSDALIDLVVEMEVVFRRVLPHVIHSENIYARLTNELMKSLCLSSIVCHADQSKCIQDANYITRLFVTIRLHHYLKEESRNCGRGMVKRNRKMLKLTHQ